MSNGEIDYGAVLSDLKAKRAALDSAILGLEQWLSLKGTEAQGVPTIAPDRTGAPGEIRSDTFFGMSIPDAIRTCLKIMKRPLALTEITKALQEGGLLTTAKDLASNISATLTRMKRQDGDVLQVQGKWGLSDWYPALRKEKLEANAKSKKGRKRGRPKASTKAAEPPRGTEAKASKAAATPKTTPEQVEQIKTLHAAGKKPGEIAKEVGLHHLAVWSILKPKTDKETRAVG
jgi:HB1, ASXL, restriction endonuclease HTH domain